MLDELVALGHRLPDLYECSPALLRLLYQTGSRRREREMAVARLAALDDTRLAYISSQGGREAMDAYRDFRSRLVSVMEEAQPRAAKAKPEKSEQRAAIQAVLAHHKALKR